MFYLASSYASSHFLTCVKADLFTDNVLMVLYLQKELVGPLGRVTIFNDGMKSRFPEEEEQRTKFTTEKERITALKEVSESVIYLQTLRKL